jgi:hypothetical protein
MSGVGPIDLNNKFALNYTDPNPNAEEQNERAWKKAARNAGLDDASNSVLPVPPPKDDAGNDPTSQNPPCWRPPIEYEPMENKDSVLEGYLIEGLPSRYMGATEFASSLEQAGLTESYANANPGTDMVKDAAPFCKDPGGVAIPAGKLMSLMESPEGLWGELHAVALPIDEDEKDWAHAAVCNDVLGQLVASVSDGVRVGAEPFFSLHFKSDGAM